MKSIYPTPEELEELPPELLAQLRGAPNQGPSREAKRARLIKDGLPWAEVKKLASTGDA